MILLNKLHNSLIGIILISFLTTLNAAPLIFVAGPHTINTDTGFINGLLSPDFNGVSFDVTNIDIQLGAVVTIAGTQALIINADNSVNISGDIFAVGGNGISGGGCNTPGGAGGVGGPGGFAGGNGGGFGLVTIDGENGFGLGGGIAGTGDDAGGGGAGHTVVGLDGLSEGTGVAGTGGIIYTTLPPLIGGSGGGGGSSDDDFPAGIDVGDDGGGGGGGGGGAIQIVATGLVAVSGNINVNGGNGAFGNCSSGAGGGGSGGVIEIIGSVVNNSGILNVSGGVSSTTGADGGNGSDGQTNIIIVPLEPLVIPTLNLWMLGLLMGMLGLLGLRQRFS